MNRTLGILLTGIVIVGCWCVAGAGSDPSSQSATASATQPATSSPTRAPSREQLEQARGVFRQLLGQLTEGDKSRVEKLIARMSSENWKDRDEATTALKKEPLAAAALIRQGANGENRETASRCKDILSAMEAQRAELRLSLRQAIATRQRAGDAAVVGDLIALLDDEDFAIRQMSGNRLSRLTGQDLGYKAAAPVDQRGPSVKKAQEWWDKNKATFVLAVFTGWPKELSLDLGNKVTMKLAFIPAGKFLMGSANVEEGGGGAFANEGPQRAVTITKPFYMGIHEVTQEQFEQISGKNPSHFKGPKIPVESLRWDDAAGFCRNLAQTTGEAVHLPTEAQWEYACRAGSKTRFGFGDKAEDLGDYAWYDKNSDKKTQAVGQKKPNAFGLYDMHGNVWEWCSDWYVDTYDKAKNQDPEGPGSGTHHTLRGGCWLIPPQYCRSATRSKSDPEYRDVNIGFRVVVDLE